MRTSTLKITKEEFLALPKNKRVYMIYEALHNCTIFREGRGRLYAIDNETGARKQVSYKEMLMDYYRGIINEGK